MRASAAGKSFLRLFYNKFLGICENKSKNLVIFHNLFIMEYGFYSF